MINRFWALALANHKQLPLQATNAREVKLNLRIHLIIALFLLALLNACGGGSGSAPIGGGLALGEARTISFDSQGYGHLEFSEELSGSEEFAVALFSAQQSAHSYPMEMRSGNLSASEWEELIGEQNEALLLNSPSSYLVMPTGPMEDPTAWLHQKLREDESLIAEVLQNQRVTIDNTVQPSKALSNGSFEQNLHIENPWFQSCAGGEGVLVKMLSSPHQIGEFQLLCVHPFHQSSQVNYYVDQHDLGRLSLEQTLPILTEFENKLPLAREVLGSPESDVNGDGRFDVVFSGKVNTLGTSSGGYITGLFHGVNLLPEAMAPESNEREILFISVPDNAGDYGFEVSTYLYNKNILPSTLIHEYQHMVNYRVKVLENEQGAEFAGLNEGLSHLCEGLHTEGDPLENVGIENHSRFAKFLADPNLALMQGTSLANRGGVTLFLRYLYHQANLGHYPGAIDGIDLIKNLVSSSYRGIQNIEQATQVSFEQLLANFYVSLILSGQNLNSSTHHHITGLEYGVDVGDNRETVLNPIHLESLSQANLIGHIPATGGWLSKFSGQTVKQAGKAISLRADPTGLPGGVLVRIR